MSDWLPIIGGAAGGLLGGLLGAASKKRLQVPELTPVDAGKEQQKAVKQNLAALPGATQLAEQVNLFNSAELEKMMNLALPGAKSKATGALNDMLSGNLPSDVASGVLRSGAAKALQGGYGGSVFGRNMTLRDLGISSLQMQLQGLGIMPSLASMFMPQLFNVSSMMTTPQEQTQFAVGQQQLQFQRGLAQATGNAQYGSPVLEAFGGFLGQAGGMAAGYGLQSWANKNQMQTLMGMLPPRNSGSYSQWFLSPSSWSNPGAYSMAQNYYEGV